jgi:hypothetical protein
MGPAALFNPLASLVNILVRNTLAPVRVESVDCDVEIEPGRKVAAIESVRLASDTVEPGQVLKGFVTLKPFKGERETIEISLTIPEDFPEGSHEATICDAGGSVRRTVRNDPGLMEPHDLPGLLRTLKVQTDPKRTAVYLHVPATDKGVTIHGQALPNLPGSVRSVFASKREVPLAPIRSDLTQVASTRWVIEGSQSLRFTVVKDTGLSLSLYR